jgi:hypothetical protein
MFIGEVFPVIGSFVDRMIIKHEYRFTIKERINGGFLGDVLLLTSAFIAATFLHFSNLSNWTKL